MAMQESAEAENGVRLFWSGTDHPALRVGWSVAAVVSGKALHRSRHCSARSQWLIQKHPSPDVRPRSRVVLGPLCRSRFREPRSRPLHKSRTPFTLATTFRE